VDLAQVRRDFDDGYRGTVLESLQNFGHWILCALVLGQFVGVIWAVTELRIVAYHDPSGTTYGIPNEYILLKFKYLVTLIIKVVDVLWWSLTNFLTRKENHRTELDLKSALVVKLFAVKFVIFYYPFAQTVFLQPHLAEGCPGSEGSGWIHIQGCLDTVREDLRLFFVTQVASQVGGILLALAMLKYNIRKEIKRKGDPALEEEGGSAPQKRISYLEIQAMVPAYDQAEEIADYMQIVTNFGFVAMFGVICPSVAFLCFISNFVIKKLTAFKYAYAYQRVTPNVQEGIGSWAHVIQFVTYIGITCTCFIVIFVYNVGDFDLSQKLILFIIGERVLVVLKKGMEAAFGAKTVAQMRIEEYNEDVIDVLLPRATKPAANANYVRENSKKPKGLAADMDF